MQHARAIPAPRQFLPGSSALKLADHLGASLEACAEFAQCNPFDLSDEAIGGTRRAELAAISHLLQARECARDAALEDWRLAASVNRFIAGTAALEHAPASQPNELTLGRRLPVTTAVHFATFMLRAYDAAYRTRAPMPPAPPSAAVARAGARHM